VVVGTYARLRQPPGDFRGTGFAVGDGRLVLTNAHVLPGSLDPDSNEELAVFAGEGDDVDHRRARVVARDPEHDLAVLRIGGEPLPALRLGDSRAVRPGERYAFTGFPIGTVLGLYPVTHEALVSAITPIAIPQDNAGRLDPATIRRLQDPYEVFQLDGTAYPGNSGSPLYAPSSGTVIGVVNMVFVKSTRENVLKDPSGIAYAIPARHARALLERARE
jgi:Trypsin-like serine proteases, typically periplasmic, contain C-terminal PDZ domain